VLEGVGDAFLRGLDIPDSITGEENKLRVSGDGDDFDVREGGDGLVFGLEHGVVLVLEVSESSRESEHAIDSAFFDEAACILDALELNGIIRLVVIRELDGDSVLGHDSA